MNARAICVASFSLVSTLWSQEFPNCSSYFDLDHPTILDGDPGTGTTSDLMRGKLDARAHDFDGDGDLDLMLWGNNVTANPADPFELQPLQFLRNEQISTSVPQPRVFIPWPTDGTHPLGGPGLNTDHVHRIYDIVIIDVDLDGDEDMVAGRLAEKDVVFLNDGGIFSSQLLNPNEASEYASCTNGGSGNPVDRPQSVDVSPPYTDPATGVIYPACDRRWTTGVAMADIFVEDPALPYPDVVLSYRASRPRVYRNMGTEDGVWLGFGHFQDFPAPLDELNDPAQFFYPGNGTRDVQLVDLTGDGKLDCVFARSGLPQGALKWPHTPLVASVLVYEWNDSQQAFEFAYDLSPPIVPGEPFHDDQYGPVSIGGMDYAIRSNSHSIAVADVDSDGDMDLIQPVSGRGFELLEVHPFLRRTRVYLNKGPVAGLGKGQHRPDGFLEDNPGPFPEAKNIMPVDLDGRGGIDLYEATSRSNTMADRVWICLTDDQPDRVPSYCRVDHFPSEELPYLAGGVTNDPGTLQAYPSDDTRYSHFADLDGDGQLDMVEANFGDGPEAGNSDDIRRPPFPRIFWGQAPQVGIESVSSSYGWPGLANNPQLQALGTPSPGNTLTFFVNGFSIQAVGIVYFGFEEAYINHLDTILALDVFQASLVPIFATGGTGSSATATFQVTWPSHFGFGKRAYVQTTFTDPADPDAWAVSNCLAITGGL